LDHWLFSIAASLVGDAYLPEELMKIKDANLDVFDTHVWITIITLIEVLLFFVSLIALWWIKNWARHLFLRFFR